MTTEFDRNLDAYAEVIIRVGLNLREGQRLIIMSPIEAAPLVRRVAAQAYRGGARLVETLWNDEQLLLTRFNLAPRDSFEEHSTWPVKALLEYLERGDALLSIFGRNPDLLQGQDPALIAAWQQTEGKASEPASRLISGDAVNWCVVAYPVASWAAKVYPDLSPAGQVERLWQAIFDICRVGTADPVAAWQAHVEGLARRAAFFNDKQYAALRFTGPGTDLTVGLPANHRWLGGATRAANGIVNTANVPTEEIFTAPHRERVDGVVRATMPLNYGGSLIDGFSVTFKDGRVVDLSAEQGEPLLRSLVEMDEGAARLGEVALVPHSSPIARTGALFYNTLFDENAASHIALGRAYRNCIAGCEDVSDDEFAAFGGNSSLTHVDFMIGSAEIDLDGVTARGAVEPLMRGGEWVEAV